MGGKNLLEGKKILIVDDESDVLESLEEQLALCEIVKAESFSKAKELLETERFDMAILDIMGVQGYNLLQIANNRNVTAVMLTAHALNPDDLIKSYKEGAASYLPKDELANITVFLNDILEAKEKGNSPWWRWFDRLASFWERKFGPKWQEENRDFWKKFPTL